VPFCLAPHPDQSVEKIVNGFGSFRHTTLNRGGTRGACAVLQAT
jgi:hypothetical protein